MVRKFVHLHAHSTYSILDSWGQPADIVRRLEETGGEAHALTDHDSTSGHWKFRTEMESAGLKPLYGIEIRVVDTFEQKEQKDEEGARFYPYHLGLIAASEAGYKNLMELTTLAWSQGMGGRGKYMPVITWDQLRERQDGLIGTSGCLSGKLSRAILGQIPDKWQKVKEEIESCFKPDHFFVEWQNIDLDACRMVAEVLAKEPNAVVTHDVHFPDIEHREAQNIMVAIRRWKKITGADGQGPMRPECYLASAFEVVKIHNRINRGSTSRNQLMRAMDNTLLATDLVNVQLPQIEMVRYPIAAGTAVPVFREKVRQGWNKRGLNKLPPDQKQVYRDRLLYEFDMIVQRDFVDYFLIISDICQFCIDNDILKGPARGSSAGSLIAWLLAITEINPLEHGLIFERFIDVNRKDLPDIDMDFQDDRREEIHEYLKIKYGEDKVGYIGTFTTFKAKNSLDDVARVYELPHWVPAKIKPYIPERSHGDVRSNMTLADSIDSFDEVRDVVRQFPEIRKAILLEGQFRGMGVHPAGFVVSTTPLSEVVPIYEQASKGRVVGLDMYDAAAAGLLKIDLLGLSTMTQIARARDAIRQFHDRDVDFYNLDLDDPETMRGFTEADVLGIFQFAGKATKNTLRQIRPTKFSELADINTLSRPGAMLAGTSDAYIRVHNKKQKPESIHPIIDRLTTETHSLVLYQEQVLAIMREFGGLTWAQASEIRKDISKRVGMEKLQRFKDDFVAGAGRQGIDEKVAMDVWLKTSTFGAYGFNKSHSVAYSVIAYWQMFVKRHYPQEFYYAALATEHDVELRNLFVMEAKRKGVPFLPIDPNRSAKTFALERDGIRYGLTQIKGVGDKTADLIIESRPIANRDDLLKIRGVGAKTADLFASAFKKGDDLFGLREQAASIARVRDTSKSLGIVQLRRVAETEPVETEREHQIAGHIISRNYRQEQKLSVQAKSADQVGAKSDTVIVYIRDESGESFPIVVPGWLANQKTKEIWEGQKLDVYIIRGRLPSHGKFFLANGLANVNWQEERQNETVAAQLQLPC